MVRHKHRGTISELVACHKLLEAGYEVFRNVSQVGMCDIVAIKHGKTEYFDVKTLLVNETRAGALVFGKQVRLTAKQAASGIKLLFVCRETGNISTDPEALAKNVTRRTGNHVPSPYVVNKRSEAALRGLAARPARGVNVG